jgi:hypothetical protein
MITEEKIKELAYAVWDQEGRPAGKDLDYYFRAKKMLEEQEAASTTDNEPPVPPASTLQPPSAPKPVGWHTGKRRPKNA